MDGEFALHHSSLLMRADLLIACVRIYKYVCVRTYMRVREGNDVDVGFLHLAGNASSAGAFPSALSSAGRAYKTLSFSGQRRVEATSDAANVSISLVFCTPPPFIKDVKCLHFLSSVAAFAKCGRQIRGLGCALD